MKKIESLITTALDAVEKRHIKNTDGTVPKEMNGYISSFGASLISAGLLPTIIFFSQRGESNERNRVITGLEYIMQRHYPGILAANTSLVQKTADLVRANNAAGIQALTAKLTQAAIALKLAVRTYPKSAN